MMLDSGVTVTKHKVIAHVLEGASEAWTSILVTVSYSRLFRWLLNYNTRSRSATFQARNLPSTGARVILISYLCIVRRSKSYQARTYVRLGGGSHQSRTISTLEQELYWARDQLVHTSAFRWLSNEPSVALLPFKREDLHIIAKPKICSAKSISIVTRKKLILMSGG